MLAKIPFPLQYFYPRRIWNIPTSEKRIYLSFDDGPIPEVTPWVLNQLDEYDAKATFFCIGDNIKKHPGIFKQLFEKSHSIGNHTNNHLDGWKTSPSTYLQNVLDAETRISEWGDQKNLGFKLFRPPYGRLTSRQAHQLLSSGYKIIMWEVLSMDYNKSISCEKCYSNVIQNAGPGSIVVFHDSQKAERNLKAVLPRVLEYYAEKGYTFGGI